MAVILILVLNYVFVWPHFSDWGQLRRRENDARRKLAYQSVITQTPDFTTKVKVLEGQGEFVAPEDQAINFMRTINDQAKASGVNISSYSRSTMHTNQFFMEQMQNVNAIATDEQLVDFFTNSAPAHPWFACVIWSFNPTTRASTSTPTSGSSPVTKNPRRPV